uniref:Putative trypsin n=1 Tax=Panstrongylus lignarius TaxID=156445 RepID=A0A224XKZ3_9HEMI
MLITLVLLVKLCSMVSSKVITLDLDPDTISDESKLEIVDAPYIVSIHNTFAGNDKEKVCTGFLIDPHWILTSAQCFDGGKVMKTLIKFAINDYSLNTTNVAESKTIIKHPFYNNRSLVNDLTLIKVKFPIWYAKKVIYIMADEYGLKWKQNILEERKCLAIGYGKTNDDDTLLYVKKLIVRYDPRGCGCFATNTELLCGTPVPAALCFNDHGGPLICNGRLVGVANKLLECGPKRSYSCGEEFYNRYTNLCAYFQWISDYVDTFPMKCFSYRDALLSSSIHPIIPAIYLILVA